MASDGVYKKVRAFTGTFRFRKNYERLNPSKKVVAIMRSEVNTKKDKTTSEFEIYLLSTDILYNE